MQKRGQSFLLHPLIEELVQFDLSPSWENCDAFRSIRWLIFETSNLSTENAEDEHVFEFNSNFLYSFTMHADLGNSEMREMVLYWLSDLMTSDESNLHGLYELFYGLPEIHRAALINRIKRDAHQSDESMEEQLRFISNAFVKSRYFFEYDTVAFTGLFDPFVKIVCDYAIAFDDKEKQNTDHTEKCCFDNKTRTGSRG